MVSVQQVQVQDHGCQDSTSQGPQTGVQVSKGETEEVRKEGKEVGT